MGKCYACGAQITKENASVEHIIPNGIGGRLKSLDLLCRDCNSSFGSEVDSKLTKQLNLISVMLGISRDRGEPQPEVGVNTRTGEAIRILQGGKPAVHRPIVKIDKEEKRASIMAGSIAEARWILRGLQKKYPNINVEEVLNGTETRRAYIKDYVKCGLEFTSDTFRAVTKIAINYYLFCGGQSQYTQHLLPYINGLIDVGNCFWYYPPAVHVADNAQVAHIIHLKGDAGTGKLAAFVQLFNAFRFAVMLSDDYYGEFVDNTYAYDLLAGTTDAHPDISWCSPQMNETIKTDDPIFAEPQRHLDGLLQVIYEKQRRA